MRTYCVPAQGDLPLHPVAPIRLHAHEARQEYVRPAARSPHPSARDARARTNRNRGPRESGMRKIKGRRQHRVGGARQGSRGAARRCRSSPPSELCGFPSRRHIRSVRFGSFKFDSIFYSPIWQDPPTNYGNKCHTKLWQKEEKKKCTRLCKHDHM